MKNTIRLVLFLLLGSTCQLHAQLPVRGNFNIGDTSQVHLLETKDGSRLVGRVIGFDQEKVTFVFNADTLSFLLANLAFIEARTPGEPAAAPVPGQPRPAAAGESGLLTAVAGGKSWSGTLKMGNDFGLRLQLSSGDSRFIAWKDMDSLVYTPPARQPAGNPPVHVLTTSRGDRFTGHIKEYKRNIFRFALEDGSILRFSARDVRKLENFADGGADNKFDEYIPMQGHERMYLLPTGFLMKQGEAELRTVIISNSIDYGVSDHFTIGGGFSTVIVATVLQAKAKVGTSLGKHFHVAAGGQLLGVASFDEQVLGAAIAYGSLALGSPENFVNFTGGYGVGGPDGDAVSFYSVAASRRVGKKFRISGEFIRFTDSFSDQVALGIVGGSWFNRDHRVDFGFVLGPSLFGNGFTLLPFPAVSYAYRF